MKIKLYSPLCRYLQGVFLLFILCTLSLKTLAQQSISGQVKDDAGLGIPGVYISVKNGKNTTLTDIDGNFKITANVGETLVVKSLGYTTKEILVTQATSSLQIQLETNTEKLTEVVVVGYGTVTKKEATGAIAQVSSKQIEEVPVQNAIQALQGRAAGVDVTSNARPGELGSIRIRGNRSLLAGNDPLYVVDGIPLTAGGIDAINPHDIETIDVLKDAASTAIFGSRGANGVVMITTKKGKSGTAKINYNLITNFDYINYLDENFTAGEYAEYRRDAYRALSNNPSSGYSTPYPNPIEDKRILGNDPNAWENIARGYTWLDKENLIPQTRPTTAAEQALWGVSQVPIYNGDLIPTTNWTDYVSRTGITQDHTLSLSMGSEKMNAYVSGGYLDQVGTNNGQDYKRYNLKTSFDLKPTTWFSLGGSITGTWSVQNFGFMGTGSRGANGIYAAALGMLPFAVPYDANGQFIYNPGADINIVNPIQEDKFVINERTSLRALGSLYAELNFLKDFKYRINFGPDFRNFRNGQFQDKQSLLRGGGAPTSTNFARLSQNQAFAWTLDNLIYYDKTINKQHKIGLTLLQSSTFNRNDGSDMSAIDLPYNSQLWYNLGSTSQGKLQGWGSNYSKYTLSSYMARVNYSLSDKYILTASARWDGSSVLAEGNKWDFFPSASVAWRMEQENFIKNINWISQLKPRLGIGVTGNSSVDPYSTAGAIILMPIVFGSQVSMGYIPSDPKAANPGTLPNRELSWEKTTSVNLGVDFGFFRDRISGSIDVYRTTTNDLLFNRPVNLVTGFTSIFFNTGQTRGKGLDFSVNTVNVDSKDFRWNTTINLSLNDAEVVETAFGKVDDVGQNLFIGENPYIFYDYKKIGIWQTSDTDELARFNANGSNFKPGDIRVEDVNGDYKIDAINDRQILGNRFGTWNGGITNTLAYKNWTLSFFVIARGGFLIEGGASDLQGRYNSRKVNYWTPDNPSNEYPRADFGNGGQPLFYSAMNYQDGTFVKVRNISLGYNLPKKAIQPLKMSNLNIYAQVLNPFLYTKNGFIDPDIFSSISSRTFVLGLNASF
ncbi:SusC/RagA family TonB-linked outer membrane protein [Pedobacter aquae]|uniref:SusC/RagA family TonB-linked outer membrane protein n=1 Tax=Pedobacter aquae TaxID=2605747 RepID=A0A5C0VHS5_9SPHI|nr:SusC/RagA family TonB-linked outer membrane protein [Pedobacter aquae]QEK51393.1 SusC/RagA family TonB-linked outer membrane protein [Pedobacter aquae]